MSDQPQGKKPKNCHATKNSPFWQYEYSYKQHTDRGSTGCRSAGEATAWVEKRKVAFREEVDAKIAGENGPAKRRKITILEACERYRTDFLPRTKEEEKEFGYKSWKSARHYLTTLVIELGGDKYVSSLTKADFIDYRNSRSRQPNRYGGCIKGSTINREIEFAARVWKHAYDVGYEVGNAPAVTIALRDRGQDIAVIRALSKDEDERLKAALTKEHADVALMAEFATLCGQRRTAVVTLKRSLVDLGAKSATVMLKRRGKPVPHTFPLSPRMIEIINSFPVLADYDCVFSYVCRRPRGQRKSGGAPRIKGERYPFTNDCFLDYWARAKKAAEVENLRWHDLRHTAATRITKKAGIAVASRLLGHANIQTTMRYAHVLHTDVAAALIAVETS